MTGREHVEQELARQLQESLDRIRTGETVLELTREQAVAQAMRLRSAGIAYLWISKVMGIYHGLWYAESTWRSWCREAGAPPRHHRNGALRIPPQFRRTES